MISGKEQEKGNECIAGLGVGTIALGEEDMARTGTGECAGCSDASENKSGIVALARPRVH